MDQKRSEQIRQDSIQAVENEDLHGITVEDLSQEEMKRRDQRYDQFVKNVTPKFGLPRNMWRAFWTGGLICAVGQLCTSTIMKAGVDKDTAALWTLLLLISGSVILTGFQLYGKWEKYGGAGLLVPITGFANSVVSPAIEYQCEGDVFGTGCKIFTIAGPVILFGIFSSWILGVLYWVADMLNLGWFSFL